MQCKSNDYISYKVHSQTNAEVLKQSGQRILRDIVGERRFRFAGHNILLMTSERPAHCAMDWIPVDSMRRIDRPKRTLQATFRKDTYCRINHCADSFKRSLKTFLFQSVYGCETRVG